MFGLEWYQYVLITLVGGNVFFLGLAGAVHYYYYHLNRDKNAEWKIQPGRFLSPRLAKHAALLGTFNLNVAAGTFGFIAWGVVEKGWGQIYYDIGDYGYGWAGLSVFLAFLFIEAAAYYIHMAIHGPWLYKHIHSIHHYYSTPTYFTISSMHPLEWVIHSSYILAPVFLFPMHWALYLIVMMTTFLYGFWDHSGIKLKHNLPFHGTNQFHDDHHKYFHVNYGFLTPIFDRLHDTVRRQGHHYTEDSFTKGKGRVKLNELGNNAIGPWVDYSTPFTRQTASSTVKPVTHNKKKDKR